MDTMIFPRNLKVELPDDVVGAFKSIKQGFDLVQDGVWWAAFQQGLLWGVVGMCVLGLVVCWMRKP